MEIESSKYLTYVLRRLWIVILAAIAAGGAAYLFSSRQADTYRSEVKLFIGNTLQSLNPDQNLFETGLSLARTYQQLVRGSNILTPVIEQQGLDISFEDFRNLIGSSVVAETPILTISVTYTDPEEAAELANAVAESLIRNSPADLTEDQLDLLAIQQQQLQALNQQITEAQAQLIDLGEQLINATDSDEIATLTDQRNRLREQIQTDQATFTQLSTAFSALSDRTNKLQILEPARPATDSEGISTTIVAAAGTVVGAVLAIAGILFVAYLDNRVRTENSARNLLKLPLIGSMKRSRSVQSTLKFSDPASLKAKNTVQVVESLRNLSANMLYTSADRTRRKVFVVASPGRYAGRSTLAAGIATATADTGLKVLLIDADLRNPKLHTLFSLNNNQGMISLLELINSKPDEINDGDAFKESIEKLIHSTRFNNLSVMTSGASKGLTNKAPAFDHLYAALEAIYTAFGFDVIIIDTPAVLENSDSYVLATTVNAGVLFVVDASSTTHNAALRAKEQIEQVGGSITGIIVNRVS